MPIASHDFAKPNEKPSTTEMITIYEDAGHLTDYDLEFRRYPNDGIQVAKEGSVKGRFK